MIIREDEWQRPPRVAELVAERIRARIVSGELRDGDRLPKEEELRREFPVAKTSLREALSILEAEGLLSVVRGNQGGAVVSTPHASNAAYTIGLVLAAREVPGSDVAHALRFLEPLCGEMCAARPDRDTEVLPALRKIHEAARDAAADLESLDEREELTSLTRRFHETIVASCGNETLIVVVGALEELWTSHVRVMARVDHDRYDEREHRAGLDEHGEILDLIAAGDREGLRRAMTKHLEHVQPLRLAPYDDHGLIGLPALRPL